MKGMGTTAPSSLPEPLEPASATWLEHQRRIGWVLTYLNDHLGEPLDLAQLARVAALSPSHFRAVFRGMLGESVWQYVKRLRLERAAFRLRYTQQSVLDIALASGFESHEAFTRAFTQAFRCAPRRFRHRPSLAAQLPAPTNQHYHPGTSPAVFDFRPDESGQLSVRLVERPAVRVAYLRLVGPYSKALTGWARLLAWAWRKGRLRPGLRLLGVCHDDELFTAEEHLRYDAALAVEPGFTGDGAIQARTLEAGWVARCTVRGSLEEFWHQSGVFCYQWFPQSGLTFRDAIELHEYHLPAGVYNPLAILATTARRMHVDIDLPVHPGPLPRPARSS